MTTEVVGLAAAVNMLSWSKGGEPHFASEREKRSTDMFHSNFEELVKRGRRSLLLLAGVTGRAWDYSRGKTGFSRYWKDARGLIAFAQLIGGVHEDYTFSSHVLEMAASLSLDKIGGLFLSGFAMRDATGSVMEKLLDKVEEKSANEAKETEERVAQICSGIEENGIMLGDDDLAIFLAMISKFLRDGDGDRSVTIICKGNKTWGHVGIETVIEDTKELNEGPQLSGNAGNNSRGGVTFKQICIGKCGGIIPWEKPTSMKGAIVKKSGECGSSGRFRFKHTFAENCQSYAVVREVVEDEIPVSGPDGRRILPEPKKSTLVQELVTGTKTSRPPELVLGPIIGKVTSNCCVVMLELGGRGCSVTVTANCVLTGHTVAVRESFVEGGKPINIILRNLDSDCTYCISVEGPSGAGAEGEVLGTFSTIPKIPCALNFAVVNGNKINGKEVSGGVNSSDTAASAADDSVNSNLWDWIARDLDRDFSPTNPDFILHLGMQVDVKQAYDESRLMLERHRKANLGSLSKLPAAIHDKMKELFRESYRVSWGRIPNVKQVLSKVPSIMVCGIGDIMGTIIRQSQLEFEPEIAAVALHVAREYQLKLTDPFNEVLMEGELDNLPFLTNVKKEELISPLGHFHRFGRIGILCIDVLSSNMFKTGRNVALPLISGGQMQWLTKVIGESEDEEAAHREYVFRKEQERGTEAAKERRAKKDESDLKLFKEFEGESEKIVPKMHSLIVACEQPVVWYRNEDAKKLVSDPRRVGNGSAILIKNSFSYHVEDCGKLLTLLFAWKQKYPGRDVLLLCGSAGMGSFNTEITDNTTGLKIRQQAVAGITAPPAFSFDCELEGKIGNR